jgi:uncharacterized protein
MLIVPRPDYLTAPYWEGAKNGHLLLQHCQDCGHKWHPPTVICPDCQSYEIQWVPSCGRGVIHSFIVVAHAVHPAMEGHLPLAVILVELEEGPRVVANLLNSPVDGIEIGQAVQVTFQEIAPGIVLPQFLRITG